MKKQKPEEVVMGVKLALVDESSLKTYATAIGVKASPKWDVRALVVAVTAKTTELRKADMREHDGAEIEYVECDCGGIAPASLAVCPFCGAGEVNEPEEVTQPVHAIVLHGDKLHRYVKPEDELKQALKHAKSLVVDWHASAWEIGAQLLVLTAETPEHPALWKLVKGEDGTQQRYRGFAEFVFAELGLKPDAARTFMYLAKECTRAEVEGWTISKVGLVLNAPEAQRKQLLQTASALPASEVRARVQELKLQEDSDRKEKGLPPKKDKTGASREKRLEARQKRAAKEHAAKDAAGGVFTFVMSGQVATAKLFRKTPDATENYSQATSATDAWGWLDGKNGAKLVFRLEKDAKGHLKIRFEGKREDGE